MKELYLNKKEQRGKYYNN